MNRERNNLKEKVGDEAGVGVVQSSSHGDCGVIHLDSQCIY